MAIKKTTPKKAAAKKVTPVKETTPAVKAPAPVAKKGSAAKKTPASKPAPVVKAAAPEKVVATPAGEKVKYTEIQKEVIQEMQNSGAQFIISSGTGSGLSKDPTSKEYVIFKTIHTNTGKALLKFDIIKKLGKSGLIYTLTKKGAKLKF